MKYAGIGSRRTPPAILSMMEDVAEELARRGWFLRSGGAEGADLAFERGCDRAGGEKEIFLIDGEFTADEKKISSLTGFGAVWGATEDWLHVVKNCRILFGKNLDEPVGLVLFWDDFGGATQGVVDIAKRNGIPAIPIGEFVNP